MRIEPYSDLYYLDVMKLVENFHKEAVGEYLGLFDPDAVIETIKRFNQNAFLMIVDDACQGIFAGMECPSLVTKNRVFQEIIWYVNKPYRRHGIALLKNAEKSLKEAGVSIMIMAVLENSKAEKIKSFYQRLGYRPMEAHYVRNL